MNKQSEGKKKTRQESLIVGTKKVTFQSNYVKYYMVIQPKLAILLLFKSKAQKKERKCLFWNQNDK